jgi:hypothetical protein
MGEGLMLKLLYVWEEAMIQATMEDPAYAALFAHRAHCGNSYVKLRAEAFIMMGDVPPDEVMRELWAMKLQRKAQHAYTEPAD